MPAVSSQAERGPTHFFPQTGHMGGEETQPTAVLDAQQASIEAGDICNAVDKGLIQWSKVHELRHVVSGAVSGRDNEGQIVYAKIMGTGVADVAAAKLAYDCAKAQGLGREMDW